MTTDAQKKAQAKYDKENTVMTAIKLNKNNDLDIIKKLETVDNKQGYIKELIRRDLKMKKWYLIDECESGTWTELLDAETKEEAIFKAKAAWERLSDHDKKRRASFYICLASVDEDDVVDFNTATECIDIA